MSDIRLTHRPAADLDASHVGRTVMIGCYPAAELLHVEQLPIVRMTLVYTSEGMTPVPWIAPVTIMDAL